jgi:hypothetical protein
LYESSSGKLVLIDFGLSVKKTELGEKQTYPDHLHSKNYKRHLTWNHIKNTNIKILLIDVLIHIQTHIWSVQMNKKKNFKYANAKWYEILKNQLS